MNFRLYKLLFLFCFISIVILQSSCSKNAVVVDENKPIVYQANGKVEKGPFVRGSSLFLYELDDRFVQSGRSFKTELIDDQGRFNFSNLELKSPLVQVSVQSGYYFNEVTGQQSGSPLSLNAVASLEDKVPINVNLLTHLEEKRVIHLVKSLGVSLAKAKPQAQKELYDAFLIKDIDPIPAESFSLISGTPNATILLGISAALLLAADSDNARLTELLSEISVDLEEDGKLNDLLLGQIRLGIEKINPKQLNDNVKKKYQELGIVVQDFPLTSIFSINLPLAFEPPGNNFEMDVEIAYNLGIQTWFSSSIERYFGIESLYSNSNNGSVSADYNDFYTHQVKASNQGLNDLFVAAYRTLNEVLHVAEYAHNSTKESEQLYQYKLSPYIAYQYWMIANLWGDPFYITIKNYNQVATSKSIAKSAKQSVFIQLIGDLERSLAFLEKDYAHDADFTRAMLAKLSLEIGDYQRCLKYASAIVKSKRYILAPLGKIHSSELESIKGYSYTFGVGSTYDNPLKAIYSKGDFRHVIRYSEILLLLSEAYYKLNNKAEAIKTINLLKQRNRETELTIQSNDVLQALQQEYRNQLQNEGVYFAFLKRNAYAVNILNIKPYQMILPIPLEMISMNPQAVQNSGY